MSEKIKIAELERPPDTSKGGILLPAPLQLEMRQLAAIPALLRLARAAKRAYPWGLPSSPGETQSRKQVNACKALRDALAAFDFGAPCSGVWDRRHGDRAYEVECELQEGHDGPCGPA